jgi:hypothetical protein
VRAAGGLSLRTRDWALRNSGRRIVGVTEEQTGTAGTFLWRLTPPALRLRFSFTRWVLATRMLASLGWVRGGLYDNNH